MSENIDFDREEFLINVADDIEARIIESKLKLYGIPVMRKYRGASAYVNLYTGNTMFGIDLYVPSRALDTAKDIIKTSSTDISCDCEDDADADNENGNYDESLNEDKTEEQTELRKPQDGQEFGVHG